MTTPTIQPCPFCGDTDPAIDQVELGVWAIVCNDCNCTGPIEEFHTGKGQSAELAIKLWNRPATPNKQRPQRLNAFTVHNRRAPSPGLRGPIMYRESAPQNSA